MGKSTKKPIIKSAPRNSKKSTEYWKVIRRTVNTKLKSVKDIEDAEELEIPDARDIVDDFSYCDNIIDFTEWDDDHIYKIKAKRK